MLDIVWKQDRNITGQDYWYLRIRAVLIGNIPLYITATNDSARYEWCLCMCCYIMYLFLLVIT